MTTSLLEFIGGLGMISMTICCFLSIIMYFHSITKAQRQAAVFITVLCAAALAVCTAVWIVGM